MPFVRQATMFVHIGLSSRRCRASPALRFWCISHHSCTSRAKNFNRGCTPINADAPCCFGPGGIRSLTVSLIGSVLICVHRRASAVEFSSDARPVPSVRQGSIDIALPLRPTQWSDNSWASPQAGANRPSAPRRSSIPVRMSKYAPCRASLPSRTASLIQGKVMRFARESLTVSYSHSFWA